MTPIPHGYTIHDLDRIARLAAVTAHTGSLDSVTCYELAWSAVAEYLCTAEEPPLRRDLVNLGRIAVHAELEARLRDRGYRAGKTALGPGASPNWARYWRSPPQETRAEERFVEHLAAAQIWELLTARQRQVLEALAVFGTQHSAAEALGTSSATFSRHLSSARLRFRQAWYAPDTPPPVQSVGRRRETQPLATHCRKGHALVGDNVRLYRRRRGKVDRACRACEHDRNQARTQRQQQRAAAG